MSTPFFRWGEFAHNPALEIFNPYVALQDWTGSPGRHWILSKTLRYDRVQMKANPARNAVSKARILRRTLFLLPALLLGTFSFGQTATQNEPSPRLSSDELLEQHLGKGYEALGIDPTLVMRSAISPGDRAVRRTPNR